MSVWKHPKTGNYHYDFRIRGRRFVGPCRTGSKAEAQALERIERGRAEAQIALEERLAREPMTVDQATGRYWIEVGQHHVASKVTWTYLNMMADALGRRTRLRDVTQDEVARIIAARRADRAYPFSATNHDLVSNTTVNRSVVEFYGKVFHRARVIWGEDLPAEPKWRALRLTEPKERVREATVDEEDKLRQSLRDDHLPVFAFAIASGLRLAEAVDLTWDRIDWPSRIIRVTGKGDKERLIPLTQRMAAILAPLRGNHPRSVFTYVARRADKIRKIARGQHIPLTTSGLKSRWRRDRADSGVVDLRYHDLRHTFATRTLRAAGNIRAVQKALGHEKLETTEKYAHALVEDIRQAMETADSQHYSLTNIGDGNEPITKKA